MLLLLNFQKNGTSCKEKFVCTDNPGKKLLEQIKEIKQNRTEPKQVDIYFYQICCCFDQSFISGRETGHEVLSPCSFSNFQYFPNILSPESFGNQPRKLYRNFIILEVKSCFTFGESNLYKKVNIAFVEVANIELMSTFPGALLILW